MKPLLFLADRFPDGGSRNLIALKPMHIILAGGTGSGKTRAAARLVAELAYTPEARVWIVSYKFEDLFAPLLDVPGARVYMGNDSLRGLEDYFNTTFKARMDGDRSRAPAWLLLDELGLLVTSMPKKEGEAVKAMLSALLAGGRSLGCWVVVGTQRNAAELYNFGSRDNFGAQILLGNPTKQSAEVMGFDRDALLPVYAPGEGHILLNGVEQIPCRVAANLGDEHIMSEVMRDVEWVVTR